MTAPEQTGPGGALAVGAHQSASYISVSKRAVSDVCCRASVVITCPDRVLMPADRNARDVTALLADVGAGVPGAADRLAAVVMKELHRIAEAAMHREVEGHTLQPTELVDEALMRLLGQREASWTSRTQFYAVAAQTIRRILVDHARHRCRVKRDYGVRVTLNEGVAETPGRSVDLIALDDALEQLEALAPRQARVVELRFFGGLDIEETATALQLSPATVKRDWTFARAFLLKTLEAA